MAQLFLCASAIDAAAAVLAFSRVTGIPYGFGICAFAVDERRARESARVVTTSLWDMLGFSFMLKRLRTRVYRSSAVLVTGQIAKPEPGRLMPSGEGGEVGPVAYQRSTKRNGIAPEVSITTAIDSSTM